MPIINTSFYAYCFKDPQAVTSSLVYNGWYLYDESSSRARYHVGFELFARSYLVDHRYIPNSIFLRSSFTWYI